MDADLERRRSRRAELTYVRVRQGERICWLAKGTLKTALQGPFEILEERLGADLVGWHYDGPFDELPAVRERVRGGHARRAGRAVSPSGRRLGRGRRGRGHGHRPHRAGLRRRGLQARARSSACRSSPRSTRAASSSTASGRSAAGTSATSTEPIVEHLKREGRFYRLEPYIHRYPHCWRCGTPLVFRLVDEWFISMGPVYDQATLGADEGRGRREPPLPDHGGRRPDPLDPGLRLRAGARLADQHARLDDQQEALLGPGAADLRLPGVRVVRRHRRARGAEGTSASRAGTRSRAIRPHRPYVDAVTIACSSCGEPVSRIADVGNPWLDAGIVPFSTLHFREDPDYWAQWYPADFITESFPGQFRNWFYSMLAMGTVLRREPPFKTIFGYALVFGEDGRPMHKSCGQRDRLRRGRRADGRRRHALAVHDRPARGEHPLRLARGRRGAPRAARPVERLLVLRDVRPARRLGRRRDGGPTAARRARRRSTAGSCRARPASPRRPARELGRLRRARRRRARSSTFIEDLSTWYLRRSRDRMSRGRRRGGSRRRVRDAPRRARRPCPRRSPRSCRSSPRRCTRTSSWRSSRAARQRPPDALAGRRAGRLPRRAARGGDGDRAASRRAGPDAARAGRAADPPAARPALAGAAGRRPGRAGRAPRAASATRSTSRRSS